MANMLKKLLFLTLLSSFSISISAQKILDAKDAVKEMDKAKDAKEGWTKVGGIGLNLNLLNLINPRVGAGNNQIGLGGVLNYSANLVRDKILWDNKFLVQLATIKASTDPWTKATDVLQGTTQWGYKVAPKWYVAGLGDLQTQLLKTYGTNYLKETVAGKLQTLTGKLFAPAILKLAPGVIFKPTNDLKFLFSPFAYKGIFVGDEVIAKQGTFIPIIDGKYKKADHQIGAELRMDLAKKLFDGKVAYVTTLDLYSNYLRDPQNVDVEWYNSLDFMVANGISVNLRTDWFYDHDIQVFKGGDVNAKGRDVFVRNALLLKYSTQF
jgi:Protein of unknown function (DUF3078)